MRLLSSSTNPGLSSHVAQNGAFADYPVLVHMQHERTETQLPPCVSQRLCIWTVTTINKRGWKENIESGFHVVSFLWGLLKICLPCGWEAFVSEYSCASASVLEQQAQCTTFPNVPSEKDAVQWNCCTVSACPTLTGEQTSSTKGPYKNERENRKI